MLASASSEHGAQIAKQCEACHNFQEGQGAKVGPDLYGVVDRPIASAPGFNYTAALKSASQTLGGKWTFDALNKWLTHPSAVAPGTAMTFAGLSNEKQRADVIDYLDTLSAHPVPLPTAQGAASPGRQAAGYSRRTRPGIRQPPRRRSEQSQSASSGSCRSGGRGSGPALAVFSSPPPCRPPVAGGCAVYFAAGHPCPLASASKRPIMPGNEKLLGPLGSIRWTADSC